MLSQQRAVTATSTMALHQQQQCMRLPAGQVRSAAALSRPQQQQLQHAQRATLARSVPEKVQQQEQQRPALKKRSLLSALPAPLQRGVASASNAVSSALAPAKLVIDKVDPRVRGLILLNAMTLLMGSNWVVLKDSNDSFDPMTFTCLRFTLAAAAFTPFLLQGLKDKRIRNAGLEVGMWTALGYIAQSWALFLTPASRASLLSTFTVIAVPCIAGLSGEKVKPLVWACGLAALVGTTLLEQGGGSPPNVGDLLSVASALFFAFQIFRTEKTSRELPPGSNLPYMAVILGTVAAASSVGAVAVHWQDAAAAFASLQHTMHSALDALDHTTPSPISGAQPLFELIYTSFASTDLVLLIELVALQTVSSTEAALIYSLEPVSGAAMAYAFLGERWGPMGWAGAAVILAASIACQLGGAIEEDGSNGSGGSGKEDAAQKA